MNDESRIQCQINTKTNQNRVIGINFMFFLFLCILKNMEYVHKMIVEVKSNKTQDKNQETVQAAQLFLCSQQICINNASHCKNAVTLKQNFLMKTIICLTTSTRFDAKRGEWREFRKSANGDEGKRHTQRNNLTDSFDYKRTKLSSFLKMLT